MYYAVNLKIKNVILPFSFITSSGNTAKWYCTHLYRPLLLCSK